MEPVDFWRIGNVALGTITLTVLLLDLKKYAAELSRRRLYLTFALIMLVFLGIVFTIELVWNINLLGLKTALYTAACIWCLFGIWISRNDPS